MTSQVCASCVRASGFAPGVRESASRMVRTCCLAGIDRAMVPTLTAASKAAGTAATVTLERLDVPELGRLAPALLVCDVDGLDVDSLELLRRIRFVLPDCVIAVYTGVIERAWGLACHLAGANCLLAKGSSERDLSEGMRGALRSGCFTDPSFAA
jgi:DNA-binding NarL/FixJ family response regulator